jgi:hypothetical protein
VAREKEWRRVIAAVRGVTSARLTYAANFDAYQRVAFWDALDAIGIQAYFPLTDKATSASAPLRPRATPC